MPINSSPVILKKVVTPSDPQKLGSFLLSCLPLSPDIIERVIQVGGCWHKARKRGKTLRVRSASSKIKAGDLIEFYYDPHVTNIVPQKAEVILDNDNWGIWYKPASLLSQGSKYGDHASVLRQVEVIKGNSFLVHRLDREVSGLMLLSYHQKSAALMSQLFRENMAKKFYRAEVCGDLTNQYGERGEINYSLDNKKAKTVFAIIEKKQQSTVVEIEIMTGRYHQIRRHFSLIKHPVIGDPRYGRNNKNNSGIKLIANKLTFIDPFSKESILCCLPPELYQFG